jgi:hypothetical protein
MTRAQVAPSGHDKRQTWYGAAPPLTWGPRAAAASWEAGDDPPHRASLTHKFVARLRRLAWPVRRWRPATDESVVASPGAVEIRRVPACEELRTCVKGDPAGARQTAARRLLRYLDGDNRGATPLGTSGPMTRLQVAPGRFLFSVRLAATPEGAPRPCAPKVTVIAREAGFLAVVRGSGRPTHDAVARGDARLLDAISNTEWVAGGPPIVRLRGFILGGWIGERFDIAVPVTRRWNILSGE